MSDQKPGITLVTAQAFFHELVSEAVGRRNVSTKPEVEFYLVNLLNQFLTTDRLYAPANDGTRKQEPLALMVKEALEAAAPQAKKERFKHIGDVSLYVAGFFQDSLNRKLVDVDYYINMGGTAYRQVASLAEASLFRSLYEELANKFAALVDVLAEVSQKTSHKTEKDLLRLYEVWVTTRSDRAAKALQAAGILPNDTIKKDWQ